MISASLRARQAFEPGDLSELGSESGARGTIERPGERLAVALDGAPDQKAEAGAAFRRVVELGERDPVLGRPAERVDPGGHVPDSVPGDVLVAVVEDGVVGLHTDRVHHELEAGAPVVPGVEHHNDLVRRGLLVATGEEADDAVGVGIEGADEDVEVARVVGNPRDGGVTRGRAFAWLGLEEPVDGLGLAPDGVVVGAVEHRRLGRAGGPDTGDLGGRRVWKRSRRGDLSLYDQQHAECGAQGFARGKDASLDTAGWRMVGWGGDVTLSPCRCAQGRLREGAMFEMVPFTSFRVTSEIEFRVTMRSS